MREIRSANYLDYLFLLGDVRTAFSDYSVKNVLDSNGNLYFMYIDGVAAGFICAVSDEMNVRVLYGYTREEYRSKGIFGELLKYTAENSHNTVRISISQKHKCYTQVLAACISAGFTLDSSCIVYSGTSADYVKWKDYAKGSGGKLLAMLERQGFECKKFSEAGDIILSEIYNSEDNEYKNTLPVKPFFDKKSRCMDMELSCAAIKNGHAAAYCLVSRPDKHSAVFEHISSAEKYRTSGVILLAFSGAMAGFEQAQCKRALYAMYDSNVHSNAFRKKIISMVTSSQAVSENYIYRKGV